MSTIGLTIGVLLVFTGAAFASVPRLVLGWFDLETPRARHVAVAVRAAVGVALLVAAPASRFRPLLSFLGVVSLLGGIVIAFIQDEQWGELVRFWTKDHLTAYRALSAVSLIPLGVLIAYGALT